MADRWWRAAICVIAAVSPAWADGPTTGSAAQPTGFATPAIPPLGLICAEVPQIPGGTPVSRPLQPVQFPDSDLLPSSGASAAAKLPSDQEMAQAEVMHPLGRSWESLEFLVWWPKAHPLPPLVTATRGATPPVLGGPNTLVLVGDDTIASPDAAGARFTFGVTVNEAETVGLAITYLFLGSRTSTATVSDLGMARTRFVARPILNASTQQADVIPVAIPGAFGGTIEASTTTRVTGWEINGITNLFCGPQLRLNALAGYRYFMANEGLRLEQTTLFPPNPASPAPVMVLLADQFDAHNRFHGGQFGLVADVTQGPVFLEMTGKVGLGHAVTVVKVSGQSTAIAANFPIPGVLQAVGGVLGQPTNGGRFVRSTFATLPEAGIKLGYRFRDRSRFYVGYSFVYLSEAVRPGDQVDLAVDPAQVPFVGRPAPGAALTERPAPVLARSDFWVQGLVFGLEYRY